MVNAITGADLSWPSKLGKQAKRNCPERTTCIPPWRNEGRGLWATRWPVTDTCTDERQHWKLSPGYAKLIRVDGTLHHALKNHHSSKHSLPICLIKPSVVHASWVSNISISKIAAQLGASDMGIHRIPTPQPFLPTKDVRVLLQLGEKPETYCRYPPFFLSCVFLWKRLIC